MAIAACSVGLCLLAALAVGSRSWRAGACRPTGIKTTLASLPFPEQAKLRPPRGHQEVHLPVPHCPLPWPVALVSLSMSSSQPWDPFTFIQVPLSYSPGAPRASLSHDRSFVGQCLCLEEGWLHADSCGLYCVRHRLQHNCRWWPFSE